MRRMWVSGAAIAAACVMAIASGPKAVSGPIPGDNSRPGASAAFTSDDGLIVAACRLVDEGKFSDAEKLLHDGGATHPAAAEMLDVIGRVRVAYSLGADALLARLRESIPDVTAADLERWRLAGQVQYRVIDGAVAYFSREPANVFRFCDEAMRRRRPPPEAPPTWKLEDHLARVIATARRDGKPDVVPIRHRVRFTLTIPPGGEHWNKGALVRVWLPFPQEWERQRDVKLIGASPAYKALAPNASEKPWPGSAPQRTIYFEERLSDLSKPLIFEETFSFTSWAYYPILDASKARPLPEDWAGGNLDQRPPHILFTPELRETVARIVGNETNPLARARKIFHFIAGNLAYCAEEEYSTIPSLSRKALSSRRGDCGIQSMLFITMCRAAGIPARWQSGWETKRIGFDMHDWAEFYVRPWGWLPADPSYGLRPGNDPDVREFYFGHQDSYRMIVNTDYGALLVPPKQSLRSEPLDFQRGEVEIDGHNLYFPRWGYDFNVEWLDEGP